MDALLQLAEIENPMLQSVWFGIKRSFRYMTSYKMPHPGNRIASASSIDYEDWTVKGGFCPVLSVITQHLALLEAIVVIASWGE